jgi:hypothetical protein
MAHVAVSTHSSLLTSMILSVEIPYTEKREKTVRETTDYIGKL